MAVDFAHGRCKMKVTFPEVFPLRNCSQGPVLRTPVPYIIPFAGGIDLAEFLAVKNWHKYQPARNGKRSDWIKDYTIKDSDPDYSKLTIPQRYILDGIRRLTGREGKHVPNDPLWVGRALCTLPQERHNIGRTIAELVRRGFLVLCNEQNISPLAYEERREEEKRGDMPNPAGLKPEVQVNTEELDPLVISHKVIEELGLPTRAVGLVPAIGGAVEFCLKNEPAATTKQAAMEFLIAEGKAQLAAGGGIDRFWFESQKWRKKRKAPEPASSGTVPATEYLNQIRKRKAEVAEQIARSKVQ